MKIPKNMTKEETLEKIDLVVNRISPKYTFSYYDVDDIKQEAYIICIEALDRYDEKRPLENFLSVNLSNRLKNLIRDNYYVSGEEEKKRVMKPTSIISDNSIIEENDISDSLNVKMIKELIENELPSYYRADYLKLINNVYIPKKRKEDLLNIIRGIVGDADA